MKITMHEISVKEIFKDYINNGENGVSGYGGKLNIRPKYQRNFIYSDEQQAEVLRTVMKNFPLNIMYWVDNGGGNFEVLDGQQRTISICDYVKGNFGVDGKYFHSLDNTAQENIFNYKLTVYFCQSDSYEEKINWFKVVNIAGEKLFEQELLNAVFASEFVDNARSYFSQSNCAAYRLAKNYLNGSPIRQDYLETVLKWLAAQNHCSIEEIMSLSQRDDPTAENLIRYFRAVIDWVQNTFVKYHKEMKGLDWGNFFNEYHYRKFDVPKITKKIEELMADEDVTSKRGIYKYILTGEEKYLNVRAFDDRIKKFVYKQQGGKCALCQKIFPIENMHADHIKAWSKGGKTVVENCQMLCERCNLMKSARELEVVSFEQK